MLSDVEAMHLNRSPRPMLPGQGMQRMHHAAIPAPDVQNTQRTSFSEAVTLVQISADHVEDMLMCDRKRLNGRSEEHTSELQSLMRSSYAVFCLKKKTTDKTKIPR